MKTRETTTPVKAFDRAYINGQFVTPHGTQIVDLVNPTDNKVIGKVTMADEIDARKAIGAAKEAFNSFSQSCKEYRMELLQRLHDAVAKRMDQLVEATVVEYGAPQERAKGSNNLAANIFLHFKKVLEDFDLIKTVGTSKLVMEPAGVVGIFTPWNSSAGSIAVKVAPAIAAGCTVVIKPSEMSAMQTEVLMDAFHEAGLPPGVINVVTGLGEVVGTELTKSPDIQKIAFTGSTQIGKIVARNALDTVKRLTRAAVEKIKMGDPKDKDVTLGPLASTKQYKRVQEYIKSGVEEGAELVIGGEGHPRGLEGGNFVKPTVFANVTREMRIAKEEIFGPVLSILTYKTEAEAIEIANDTEFGLIAYVSSADRERATRVARKLAAGRVLINTLSHDPLAPFGGFKQSGIGREGGVFGLQEYLEPKAIIG